ncbi:hypothetical protein HPP92_021230 [Vanilla planifolia]|uniref:Uncharacterized protein n=1 Tax=Vanilla planifolia TaxID=51239 RepID=A0A835PXR3_VANPL|nr:hypothetical protein HPP92_021230 [Vanilla planifolia]
MTAASTSPPNPNEETALSKIDPWREEMKRSKEVAVKKIGPTANGNSRSCCRVLKALRNLLTCKTVEKTGSVALRNHRLESGQRKNLEKNGYSESRNMGERATSANHKPVAEPKCSQCGRPFKPEKLHSHMKSCKALKEKGRSGTSDEEKAS